MREIEEHKEEISITWCVDDVKTVRPDLDEEQCCEVLYRVNKNHNAEIGVNWDVIKEQADYSFPVKRE